MSTIASMSDRRRNITIESDLGSEVHILGCLADGRPDEDGQILDLDWLWNAVGRWLETSGTLRLGAGIVEVAGTVRELVRGEGGAVCLRAVVVTPEAVAAVREGTVKYGFGITRPVVSVDPAAPMGRIAGGDVLSVFLDWEEAKP
jgi:hypothetical protein